MINAAIDGWNHDARYLPFHARAALGVGNNMIDDDGKLGGLLFDVGPFFMDSSM
jgi:hypothetical protein